MSIETLVVAGDSLAAGAAGNNDTAGGGPGAWWEWVAERLADLKVKGPRISSGFRGLAGLTGAEWSSAGTWTRQFPNNADSKTPYNQGWGGTVTADILTYTRPTRWRAPVGFALYWVDTTAGGDWQYRLDGAGSWINMGQTLAHDHTLNKFYVASAFTSTVEIRCFNGAANVPALIAGIELYFLPPSTPNGLIVHNLGVGGTIISNFTGAQTSGGDAMAFLDSIKVAAGAIPSTPTLGAWVIHINDVSLINDPAAWDVQLGRFHARASPLGPVVFLSPWEAVGVAADQAAYRAQTKTTAAGLTPSPTVVDFYDIWAALGFTGMAAQLAHGFTLEGTHPTAEGHRDIGERLYWLQRNRLALGPVTNAAIVGTAHAGDTIQTVGSLPGPVLGTAAELDTAFVLARRKTRLIGLPSETDTAFALGRRKTKVAGLPVETDTAFALTRAKTKAVAAALETDTAFVLGRRKTRTLGLALEVDTAFALGRRKTRALGTALEVDTGIALGHSRARAIGAALEVDTGRPVGHSRTRAIGTALETDTSFALAHSRSRSAGTASETDTAFALGRRKTKALASALETDTAIATTARKTKALASALEVDTAFALGRRKTKAAGTALEVDTAFALGRRKTRALGTALEVDTGVMVMVGNNRLLPTALEFDTGIAVGRRKTKAVTTPLEADTGRPLTATKVRSLGTALEADTGRPLTARKTRAIITALELDTGRPLTATKARAVAAALELDVARPLLASQHRTLGTAPELDTAGGSTATHLSRRDFTWRAGTIRRRLTAGAPYSDRRARAPSG